MDVFYSPATERWCGRAPQCMGVRLWEDVVVARAEGFPPPADFPLFRKNGVFLGSTAAALSVFILKTCFQCTLLKSPGWSQVCDSQVQVQVCKLPAEVCKRRGCLEECQLRSSQELQKEPEPRTLHGKSAPSSSGRNSCLRILICLAKLSYCDQGGNAEPKLDRVIQVEVGPFVGRLFVSSLQNVSPWCPPWFILLLSFLRVHDHLVNTVSCLFKTWTLLSG